MVVFGINGFIQIACTQFNANAAFAFVVAFVVVVVAALCINRPYKVGKKYCKKLSIVNLTVCASGNCWERDTVTKNRSYSSASFILKRIDLNWESYLAYMIPVGVCVSEWVSPSGPSCSKLDSATHRINHYPVDNPISFPITYPLDSDLSGG